MKKNSSEEANLFLFALFFLIFTMLCWFLPYKNAKLPSPSAVAHTLWRVLLSESE